MGTVAVDGAALACDVRGDGPCVVFVHGTGTHRLTFEPVLDALPAGHALVTYDRRGFGGSQGVLARRMDQHADDLATLIQHVSRAPATVVAQSGGAIVALQLAARRPELVHRLILAEPVVQLARVPSLAVLRAMSALQTRRMSGRKAAAVTGFYRWASGRRDGTSSWDTVPEEWRDLALQHADAVIREIRQMTVPIPSSRTIRSVTSPTTVVIGDVGQPVFHRTTRRVARLIQGSEMADVPDTGHLIAVDQPVAFAATVAEVLAS
ncbi:MAG: alpha/beta fold hydrolase [Acidimicrobiales bacterium]